MRGSLSRPFCSRRREGSALAPGGGVLRDVEDWAAHAQREERRYRDGEARLGAAQDADARQRQLTRMGNAASGAGLALLMGGRGDDAAAWFDRAARRYRESFADAPAGSW